MFMRVHESITMKWMVRQCHWFVFTLFARASVRVCVCARSEIERGKKIEQKLKMRVFNFKHKYTRAILSITFRRSSTHIHAHKAHQKKKRKSICKLFGIDRGYYLQAFHHFQSCM